MKKVISLILLWLMVLSGLAQSDNSITLISSEMQQLLAEQRFQEVRDLMQNNRQAFVQQDELLSYCIMMTTIGAVQIEYEQMTDDEAAFYKGYADTTLLAIYSFITDTDAEAARNVNCWNLLKMITIVEAYCDEPDLDSLVVLANRVYYQFGIHDIDEYYFILDRVASTHWQRERPQATINVERQLFPVLTERVAMPDKRIVRCEVILGKALMAINDTEQGLQHLEKAYDLYQQFPERNSDGLYCELLWTLTDYESNNASANYERYCQEYLQVSKTVYGEDSHPYVLGLLAMGNITANHNNWQEFIHWLELADSIAKVSDKIKPADKLVIAEQLNHQYANLGINKHTATAQVDSLDEVNRIAILFMQADAEVRQNKAAEAIPKLLELRQYYEQQCRVTVPDYNYYRTEVNLSRAYEMEGRHDFAARIMDHALHFLDSIGDCNPLQRHLYAQLGYVYVMLNDYVSAARYLKGAISIFEAVGDAGINYAFCINNLATVYAAVEDFDSSKQLFERALSFFDKSQDSISVTHLTVISNMGKLLADSGDNQRAEQLFRRVIEQATDPSMANVRALAINNLAIIQFQRSDYNKALQLLESIPDDSRIEKHSRDCIMQNIVFSKIFMNDATVVDEVARMDEASRKDIADVFAGFSAAERDNYWTEQSRTLMNLNNMVASKFPSPQTLHMAYDNALYTKTMHLQASTLMDKLARQSGSQTTIARLEQMNALKRQMTDKSVSRDSAFICQLQYNELERQLILDIPDFSQRLQESFATMEQVGNHLGDNEVAVEFIIIPKMRSYDDISLSYGALILHHGDNAPTLVTLGQCNDLDDVLRSVERDEQIDSLYQVSNTALYDLLWRPIDSLVADGSTIYFSPTGFISNVNLAAIGDGSHALGERYQLVCLSSTSQLTNDHSAHALKTAVIYGNIDYNESPEAMSIHAQRYATYSPGDMLASRGDSKRGSWSYLPGTVVEARAIDSIMQASALHPQLVTGGAACEEAVKDLSGHAPDVIHFATHGFYLSDPSATSIQYFTTQTRVGGKMAAMNCSGLIMAGANNAWNGDPLPDDVEDGILTADEISRIDLSGTQLAVLSACQTGLGQVDAVDGVFGLQRGFKKAGVQTLLMSLWEVDDAATQILMTEFYRQLLAGASCRVALQSAQQQLRAADGGQFDHPQYWAAFVLLDALN